MVKMFMSQLENKWTDLMIYLHPDNVIEITYNL